MLLISYFYAVKIQRKYISRGIEIASKGLGTTAPNPMVGAVIVHSDKIIGEGYTSPFGGPHAEVNAINSVRNKDLLKEATLYVTLEPCSHYGKTPPCADLIVANKIPKVVIGCLDPHKKVSGKGVEKLKAGGSEVVVGALESECREHHKRFLMFHEHKRPYVVLKWAETLDGFIAPEKGERPKDPKPIWITQPYARQLVHQWRSEEQAILVGTNTVIQDNPKLDVRNWKGKNPLRVILDKDLKISKACHVLDLSTPTLILTGDLDPSKQVDGIDYEIIDFSVDLAEQICRVLHRLNITSVLVEGGAQTLQTFIDANLWDEARVFTGEVRFLRGIKSPQVTGRLLSSKKVGADTLKILRND